MQQRQIAQKSNLNGFCLLYLLALKKVIAACLLLLLNFLFQRCCFAVSISMKSATTNLHFAAAVMASCGLSTADFSQNSARRYDCGN